LGGRLGASFFTNILTSSELEVLTYAQISFKLVEELSVAGLELRVAVKK
jgi:hypothetical protein